ncbi:hypothetical protein BDW74DRAFT_179377 [Aspergillus multicolor]|uniref:uncharacterized protein n=1 Tax=Aspergillus multicolor TaxID=41759 RepID=UPI003CCE2ACF
MSTQSQTNGRGVRAMPPIPLPSHLSTPNLNGLPREVLGEIASNLYIEHLKSLRLTSRHINEGTLYKFGKRVSEVRRTDLSALSLTKIDTISKLPNLAMHVKELRLGADPRHLRRVGWRPLTAAVPRLSIPLGGALGWYRDNARRLVLPQPASQAWEDVIARLPNCTSFTVVRPYHDLDPRDLFEQWGRRIRIEYPLFKLAELNSIMMHSFAGGRIKVEKYTIAWPQRSEFIQRTWLVRKFIDLDHLRSPGFAAAWASIRNFEYTARMYNKAEAKYLVKLLTMAPAFENLTINAEACQSGASSAFIRIPARVSSIVPFRLKGLDLRYVTCTVENGLPIIIQPHCATLECLDLIHPTFELGGISRLFDFFRDNRFPALQNFVLHDILDVKDTASRIWVDRKRLVILTTYPADGGSWPVKETGEELEYYCDDEPNTYISYTGPKGGDVLASLRAPIGFWAPG